MSLTTLLNANLASCAVMISLAFGATFNNVVVKLGLRDDFDARLRKAREKDFCIRNLVGGTPVRQV